MAKQHSEHSYQPMIRRRWDRRDLAEMAVVEKAPPKPKERYAPEYYESDNGDTRPIHPFHRLWPRERNRRISEDWDEID